MYLDLCFFPIIEMYFSSIWTWTAPFPGSILPIEVVTAVSRMILQTVDFDRTCPGTALAPT